MVKIVKKDQTDVVQHILVPKHTKLNDKEKNQLLEKYRISMKELPKISLKDPAVRNLGIAVDDVIKVERPSATSKTTVFYRRVTK